ncbi:HBR213Cp [Eremothecium sinecaudum]|uniref:HBR213Cp n=1 Tax=Eremothecium sinecaudum TaxID=45286 RepID=A0A120K178_9SACH|nr:HBR213Cp [Eremothecium sinecaudum]AMD19114.1 HBR213Cp [Eremothecium sinecaudum]
MPSKNSINRPKQKINLNRKIQKNAAKRNARERAGLLAPPRSSPDSMSGQVKSIPWELYKGSKLESGPTTTKTLSKKRAKKIERNLRYNEQRKLLIEVQAAKESGMEIDMETSLVSSRSRKKEAKQGLLEKTKASIWSVLEDTTTQELPLQTGAGTILGSKYF